MRSSSRPRLLVVDDDPTFRAAVARLLADHAEVLTVHSGTSALAALAETPFAMALVDAHMHPMDGFELAQRLAATAPDLPVVMATGLAPEEVRARLAAADVTTVRAILAKPLFRGDLLDALRTHCRT